MARFLRDKMPNFPLENQRRASADIFGVLFFLSPQCFSITSATGCGTLSCLSFLSEKIRLLPERPQFQTDVVKPLKLDELSCVKNLSGGEHQRVAMS